MKPTLKIATLCVWGGLILLVVCFYFLSKNNSNSMLQEKAQNGSNAIFSLSQYKDTDDAMRFLVKKLPVGTDKKVVEKYLIQDSEAVATEIYSGTISYSFERPIQWKFGVTHHRCKNGWKFEVTYDEKNLLKSIRFPCF